MTGPCICVLCLEDACAADVNPVFNPVGPRLVSTSPAFVKSSAYHPAGPHDRLPKTVNQAPISGGGKVRHNLHSSL